MNHRPESTARAHAARRAGLLAMLAFLPAAAPAATTPRGEGSPARIHLLGALEAEVEVAFDRFDVPTISARSLDDAVRAQGWIHARDRFLQMDLARRQAAGELAEIVPAAIGMDRLSRVLCLRDAARRSIDRLPPRQRELLQRYSEGINAQLAAGAPLEYRLLQATPAPWLPEDCVLVQLGMARFLDRSPELDAQRAPLYEMLPEPVARFLSSASGPLDASVDGSPLPPPQAIPSPELLDLRRIAHPAGPEPGSPIDRATPGSNAFAVAGSRTVDGRAIVGNDMHLALTAPGVWFRVRLTWPGHDLLGLSMPGVPMLVQGTNGAVAWGFTNLTADLADLVVVELDPTDPTRYLVEGGSEPFLRQTATLGRGDARETLELFGTRFGPVIERRPNGTAVALRWAPLMESPAVDFALFDMADAGTLEQALDIMRAWRGPPQNALVADRGGRIGWTIAGAVPDRDARTPVPVAAHSAPAWRGILPATRKPMVVDPPSGVLVSANQLAMTPSGALVHVLGADEAAGDRAHRLRTLLESRSDWTEAALHEVQLDTRSARLVRWSEAVRAALDAAPRAEVDPAGGAAQDPAIAELTGILERWDGHVDADEPAPVILDAVRASMRRTVAAALAAHVADAEREADPTAMSAALDDEALLCILERRPDHLLPGAHADWPALARALLSEASAACRGKDGKVRTRGDLNRSSIRHPAASALGAGAKLAEMPSVPLPGHPTAVRVQTPTFGASQRSVVSPAHLADAILVTPCGQSGLPTSPHFRNLHRPWQDGTPFPLLPGERAALVSLVPTLPAPAQPALGPAAPALSPSSRPAGSPGLPR